MIFIIDDDPEFASCLELACAPTKTRTFTNAISAVATLDEELPTLIFLDILLDGPDGFTFLNEIASYSDSAKIPVVIVSSLDLNSVALETYGVVGILDKSKMRPADVKKYVERYART